MPGFTDRLVAANRALWSAMADHPFVLGLASGTLPKTAERAWIQQDRAFVLDELAGAPAAALAGRLGRLFTDAARFELAFWEMCWKGDAWPVVDPPEGA